MAAALSLHQAGHEVSLIERYKEARPAGNILNLWPPPIKALGLMGVDVTDFGAPCQSEFRNAKGKVRAVVRLPQDVVDNYGGGFIGLLRPELYERLLAALPPGTLQVNREVTSFDQDETGVTLSFADGTTEKYDVLVGADGIDSLVRRTLWGDEPKREHNLHIFGGFTFDDTLDIEPGRCIVSHNRTTQGSWTAIRHKGRAGFQWWVLTAHDADKEFTGDFHADRHRARRAVRPPAAAPGRCHRARRRAAVGDPRPQAAQAVVARVGSPSSATPPTRPRPTPPTAPGWPPRTATTSAASSPASTSPTTPWSARHCSSSRRPGGRTPRSSRRRPTSSARCSTTRRESWRPLRDAFFDHTPFLQKVIGEKTPGEIVKQLDEIDETEARFRQTLG